MWWETNHKRKNSFSGFLQYVKAKLTYSHVLQSCEWFRNSTPDHLFRKKNKLRSLGLPEKENVSLSTPWLQNAVFMSRHNSQEWTSFKLVFVHLCSVCVFSFHMKVSILIFETEYSFPVITVPFIYTSTDIALDQQLHWGTEASQVWERGQISLSLVLSPLYWDSF